MIGKEILYSISNDSPIFLWYNIVVVKHNVKIEFIFHNRIKSFCFFVILYTQNPNIITKLMSSVLSLSFNSDILLIMRAVHRT